MEKYVFAAVDMGSNAARLLIKSVSKEADPCAPVSFYKELFLRIPLRLGADVFTTGKISKEKEEQTVRAMKAYKQLMRCFNVCDYRICATSAMREAKNGKDIAKRIEKETDLKVNVISGDEEAKFVYGKRIEGFENGLSTYAYVDVGGGSTEVVLIKNRTVALEKSYRIGTLRMLNPENQEYVDLVFGEMKKDLEAQVQGTESIDIIGSGGNINKLYKLSANKNKKNSSFSINALSTLFDQLKPLTVEERMAAYSLRTDRADVIVPAAEIFLTAAKSLNAQRIFVPMIGLADGIIDEMYEKKIAKH